MTVLLDFHDAVLYDRDMQNFEANQWLNDACIGFILRHYEHTVFPHSPHLLFMDPSVVSLVKNQCMDEEDLVGIAKGLNIFARKLLFVPTNDNCSFEGASSHWSLLVIDMVNEEAYHFDSSRPTNFDSAQITFEKMKPLLNWRVYQPVREIRNCPQQTNGFDCGIYVCLYVKIFAASPVLPKLLQYDKIQDNKQSGENSKLVEVCIENITTTMLDILTPEMATEFRKDTIELVSQLSVEYRSRKQKM